MVNVSTWWVRVGCGVAAVLMAVTLFVGAEEVVDVPFLTPPLDKVAHFTYYGVMAVLTSYAVGVRWLWVPIFLVPIVGVLDEWHQSFISGRDASAADWIADLVGTVVIVYAYRVWALRKAGQREGPQR